MKNEIPFTSQTDNELEWIYSGKHIVQKREDLCYISPFNGTKVRNDLKIYKSKELESIFIEVMNKGKEKKTLLLGECLHVNVNACLHILEKISFLRTKKSIYWGILKSIF